MPADKLAGSGKRMDPLPLNGKSVLQVCGLLRLRSCLADTPPTCCARSWCSDEAAPRCLMSLAAHHYVPRLRMVPLLVVPQRFQEDFERKRGTGVPTSVNVHEPYLADR